MAIGLPATVAPVTWSCGFVPSALPPASLSCAYFAPDSDSASKVANGPPQAVSTPILIAPSGALAGAAAVSDDEDDEPPPPPQAVSASTAAPTTAATLPGPASRFLEFLIDSPALAEGRREPLPFHSTDNRLTINADDRDHIFAAS